MATIRIYHDETEGESFPMMCMRCGADTERLVPQTFTWMPSWVHVILFLGLLPWIIVMLVTRKTVRVMVPMCDRHVNHWRNRTLYVWVGLLCWVGLGILLAIVAKDIPDDLVNVVIGLCVFGPLIWLFVGVLLAHGAIRAAEMGDFGLDLAHVNKEFAKEWRIICKEADRRRREARRERQRARSARGSRPSLDREDDPD
jgi:hypothetical protein